MLQVRKRVAATITTAISPSQATAASQTDDAGAATVLVGALAGLALAVLLMLLPIGLNDSAQIAAAKKAAGGKQTSREALAEA